MNRTINSRAQEIKIKKSKFKRQKKSSQLGGTDSRAGIAFQEKVHRLKSLNRQE